MPWLQAVARWIDERLSAHEPGIITCSNLSRAYRQIAIGTRQGVRLVFLKNDEQVIHARIVQRQHRYMPSTLLRSQFETLEEPSEESTRWLSPCEGPLPKRWPNYCSSWLPDITQLPDGSRHEPHVLLIEPMVHESDAAYCVHRLLAAHDRAALIAAIGSRRHTDESEHVGLRVPGEAHSLIAARAFKCVCGPARLAARSPTGRAVI